MTEFDLYMNKIDSFLRLIGMSLNKNDRKRAILERLRFHWQCSFHLFYFNLSIVGQIVWLFLAIATGESLLQITFLVPCLTVCLLGNFKLLSFIWHVHHIHDVIDILRKWQSNQRSEEEKKEEKIWLIYLTNVFKLILLLTVSGVIAFAVGPFLIMASYYHSTGEIKFFLPFIVWYPFDAFQLKSWPFVYLHQFCSAWVAVFSVFGPDCFFFTCCTFIHTQFIFLQNDMEQIVKKDSWKLSRDYRSKEFKKDLKQLVIRHKDLIRCVELLDVVYSKSTLFNVVTSSLIICAAGFNLMTFKNYVLMAPFATFFLYGTTQVFFYCYYGDYVMRSSIGVGDGVYNSRWYEAGATEKKYLLFVLARSQKPVKFTAYRFTDINLSAFTRILSTSWSYFALLNQMYHD